MDAIRAFIAIELPTAIRDQLAAVEQRLKPRLPDRSVRWVKPDGIHLTLKFLGQVPADQIGLITSSLKMAAAAQPAFQLDVSGAGCFPNLQRPRVIWIGVDEVGTGGHLTALQRAVELAIEPLGYPAERRPFSPHLTLGRVARDVGHVDLKRIGEVINAAAIGSLGRWDVAQVTLIKSELTPNGAVYTSLAQAPLAATT
jgi:2'-5' RNA ligase